MSDTLTMTEQEILDQIQSEVAGSKVFLYMKGTPEMPRCGFSNQVVQILNHLGVDYGARDILVELDRDRAAAARASYAFTQLFQAQVVALTEALSPGSASGEAPFEQLASPMEAAERLRKDLWVFAQLCRAAEGHLRNDDVASAESVISSIVAFLGYFQDGSYQLLRYVDYEAFDRFSALPQELKLPFAPERPVIVMSERDRPQPRFDRDRGDGMSAVVGRLRECPVFDIRFVVLSHNTIRGAAGAAILNAELMKVQGYLD